MRIIVAERDRNGRRFLDQMLRTAGHEVIIADLTRQAVSLLKEIKPDIVLMNVFQFLHAGKPPVWKLSVEGETADMPVVFVNCIGECEQLGTVAAEDHVCDTLFDRLPAKAKMGAMESIQHLCSTLSRFKRLALNNSNFDWHQAIQLIEVSYA